MDKTGRQTCSFDFEFTYLEKRNYKNFDASPTASGLTVEQFTNVKNAGRLSKLPRVATTCSIQLEQG